MSSSRRRENTFRIEFANLPKKPSFENIHCFIAESLGLSKTQVVRVQINHYLWCAFVKCVDLATAQSIVQQHDNRHEIDISGKKFKLRILMEDGAVDVRLHDLSEDISDESIVEHMSAYGQVLSIEELAWPQKYAFDDIPSGIRSVKMILKNPIKSYITVEGETTYVTYFGQKHTCKHCNEYTHTGIPCTQNKKLLVQKASVNDRIGTARNAPKTTSYANAVKMKAGPTFVSLTTSTSTPPPPLPPLQPVIPVVNIVDDDPTVDEDAPVGMDCSTGEIASGPPPGLRIGSEQNSHSTVEGLIDVNPFKIPAAATTKTSTDFDEEASDSSTASTSSSSRITRSKKCKLDNLPPKKGNTTDDLQNNRKHR